MAIYSMGRRRVIALLALSCVLLITLDLRGNAIIDRARAVFSVVLTPFDTAARTVSRPIVNAWNGITNYDQLARENEALREQVDRQKGAEIEARASIIDTQTLLDLVGLRSASSYPTVIAEVQGNSPSNFRYTIEINKGSLDGIAPGMPVVSQAGLVGRITSVSPNSSEVLLIIDPEYSVGVKVLTAVNPDNPTVTVPFGSGGGVFGEDGSSTTTSSSTTTTSTTTTTTLPPAPTTSLPSLDPPTTVVDGTPTDAGTTSTTAVGATTTTAPPIEVIRETGTLSGQGSDHPVVIRFTDSSSTSGALQVGSTVQTSGGNGSPAPANLPIGVVSSVRNDTGTSSSIVEVNLGADLTRLNYVAVVLYDPNGSAG